MSQDLISTYKQSIRLRFNSSELERKFIAASTAREQSSSLYAFLVLGFMGLSFAYLEYYALAIESMFAMQIFIGLAVLSFINAGLSFFSVSVSTVKIRLLGSIALMMLTILYVLLTVRYRPYYAMEGILLISLFALFSNLTLRVSLLANLAFTAVFIGAMQLAGELDTKIMLVTNLLFIAVLLGVFSAYLIERNKRILFLTASAINDMSIRQESWAYTLIDLDMALTGIDDFKKLLMSSLEYIGTVITFDSSVVTALEGDGSTAKLLHIDGKLFQKTDEAIWSDDLIAKLDQTRQAFKSDCYTEHKSALGKTVRSLEHFRLDIPIFNDFNLIGIISLRREDKAFDDLDVIASLSLVSQSMLIFNRSKQMKNRTIRSSSEGNISNNQKKFSDVKSDLELTEMTAFSSALKQEEKKKFLESSPNLNIAPKLIQDAIKKRGEAAKKPLLILSRDNADKVSDDCYRKAIAESVPMSVIIIEIDGLSSIREKDGDKTAYQIFSSIAKQFFSRIDKQKNIVGRYGENGMSLLMPEVDMNEAEQFSESFRQFVEQEEYKTPYGLKKATLSIGVASIIDESSDYATMLKRADMALFVAKKNGRNCVRVRL